MKLNNILTPNEVAKRLGVSIDVLLSWRTKGMPVIKISKYLFIPETQFVHWMKGLIEPEELKTKKRRE